jgi:hypothetical protein
MSSTAAAEVDWLPTFLADNSPITEELIASLPAERQDLIRRSKDILVTQAAKEWVFNRHHEPPMTDLGPAVDDWARCSLSNSPNRYVYYIINRLTGSELNVGSECVKYFGFYLEWRDMTSLSELRRFATLFRIRELVNRRLPGFEAKLAEWRRRPETLEIMPPSTLEKPYLQVGQKLGQLYADLPRGKVPDTAQTYQELEDLADEGERRWQAMEHYVAQHRNDRWAPSSQLARFLSNEVDGALVISMLKNDGRITPRTAPLITEPGFMRSLVPDLNRALGSSSVQLIEAADPPRKGYIFQPLGSSPPRFLLPHANLLLKYPHLLFDEPLAERPSLGPLVSISRPYEDQDVDYIVERLTPKLVGSGISLALHNIEFDDLLVYESVSGKYIIAQHLSALVTRYAATALDLDGPPIEELSRRLAATPSRYSPEDLADIERYATKRRVR